jgi:hypothetical protein
VLKLRGRGMSICYRKKIHKEEGEMREGERGGRSPGHKLNITNNIIDIIFH